MVKMIGLAAAAALCASPALAQNYVQLTAGFSPSGKSDVTYEYDDGVDEENVSGDLDLESGFLVGAAFGRDFGAVRGDVEVVYNSNDADGDQLGFDGVKVSQAVVYANLYYDFETQSAWSPYVGAGVGYGASRVEYEGEDEADSGFAWQIKAGVSYAASDNVTWDLGYRYQRQPEFEVDYSEPGYTERLTSEASVHVISAGVRFSF